MKLQISSAGLRPVAAFFVLAVGTLLSGCDRKPPEGQVLARVGKQEITASQISTALGGVPDTPVVRPAEAVILSNLIDQTLLTEAAREAKLDRKPDLVRQLDLARLNVVSAAYLRQLLAQDTTQPKPTAIQSYYDAHPALFAQRRVLIATEVGVPQSFLTPALSKELTDEHDPSRIADILGVKGSDALPTLRIISPEQLTGPSARLSTAQPGDSYRFAFNGAQIFGHVDEVRNMPVSLAQARNGIIVSLRTEAVQARVKAMLNSLRQKFPVEMSETGRKLLSEKRGQAGTR